MDAANPISHPLQMFRLKESYPGASSIHKARRIGRSLTFQLFSWLRPCICEVNEERTRQKFEPKKVDQKRVPNVYQKKAAQSRCL